LDESDVRNLLGQISRATEALIRTAKSSVVWPLMVISLPVTFLSLILAFFTKSELLQVVFVIFAAVSLLSFLGAFGYFMFTDPESLKSEEHQRIARAFDLIERKSGELQVNPINLDLTALSGQKQLALSDKTMEEEEDNKS